MLKQKIIEHLDNNWKPKTSFRRKNSYNDVLDSLRWYKDIILSNRDKLINKLTGNAYTECDTYTRWLIRQAQKLYNKKVYNCMYYEDHPIFGKEGKRREEHLIPLGIAGAAFMEKLFSFEVLLGLPFVDLSKPSDTTFLQGEWKDKTPSWGFPFKRYVMAGIPNKIYQSNGDPVPDLETWSLKDHFDIYPILKL